MTQQPSGVDPDLNGLRILVPRNGAWGDGVAQRIRARGGLPVVCPLVRIEYGAETDELREAVDAWNAGSFDWLVVTSANAVPAIVGAGIRVAPGRAHQRVAAVGPATANALRDAGITVDLIPNDRFSADALAAALVDTLGNASARIFLPVSELAGTVIERSLREAGHHVERVTAYRTIAAAADQSVFDPAEIDVVLVTSGSVAAPLADRLAGHHTLPLLAAIGTPSADALTTTHLSADLISGVHTIDGLLDAIATHRQKADS